MSMTLTQERPAALPEPPAAKIPEETPQELVLRPRRWTTAEYYRMGELGLFDDERVELLDGEIWTLPPQGTPHFYSAENAGDILLAAFGDGLIVRRHGPITLIDGTEPEPDVVIVPGSKRDYIPAHPIPSQVRLLVEVSDTTLRKDRSTKRDDYARAGIADYWIVNLVHRQLEVYRDPASTPSGHTYKTLLTLFDGDTLAPLSAPSAAIAVGDLFPPPITP